MKLLTAIRERMRLRDLKKSEERVNEDYQVAERDGELWLTFWGYPIVPETMLKEDAVATLLRIRQLHMEDKV